jgi:hypothetical protein
MDKMIFALLLMWPGLACAQLVTALPSASTPLTGSEVLYIIQSGVNKQVYVSSLPSYSTAPTFTALTVSGSITSSGSAGVTCSGTPSSSFATINGIVTHC